MDEVKLRLESRRTAVALGLPNGKVAVDVGVVTNASVADSMAGAPVIECPPRRQITGELFDVAAANTVLHRHSVAIC